MVIIWQNQAKIDLENYYKNTKTLQPKKYISEMLDYIDILSEFPNIGKDFIKIYKYEIKEIIYKMHKIFYYIKDEKIYILKIAHSHMNEDTITKIFMDFFL